MAAPRPRAARLPPLLFAAAAAAAAEQQLDAEIGVLEARLRALRERRAAARRGTAPPPPGGGGGAVHHSTDPAGNDVYHYDGEMGVDFRYYRDNTSDSKEALPGVVLRRWSGDNASAGSFAFAPPSVARADLDAGAQYPAAGAYWLPDDTYYVVIAGNATFAAPARPAVVHSQGDVFWVQAGQLHGPITAVGGPARVSVVSESGGGYDPQFTATPSNVNPSIDAGSLRSRSYRGADPLSTKGKECRENGMQWWPNPSPHTDECRANGGVQNMDFDPVNNTPPVLRVRFAGRCGVPYHYHATGVVYFVQYGGMWSKGDYVAFDTQIEAGEVRWVRPGWDYGPEYTDERAMQVTVLGCDMPPTFVPPPRGAYKVQQTREMTHVYEGRA